MITLSDNEVVLELLSLMKGNDREQQAKELAVMVVGLDILEEQYGMLLSKVYDARKQLAEAPEHGHPAIEQLFQEELEQLLGQCSAAKEKIIAWSKTTMEDFKQVGVSALDAAFSDLYVQKLLGEIREQVDNCTAKVMASLRQTDGKRAALLSFLLAVCTSPSRLKRISSKAAEIVKQDQGKDKKLSLWKWLGKKKEEIAAHPISKPVRNQKGAER